MTVNIGMNGRFFAGNWRPAREEITFAQSVGFRALQFRGTEAGLTEADTGSTFAQVAAALAAAGITAVMEIVAHVDADFRTPSGGTPLDLLRANLPAITALPCACVHWHPVLPRHIATDTRRTLERQFHAQYAAGVEVARQHGFRFGTEHNEPAADFFSTPESCLALLDAAPGLGFVWDINHTSPAQVDGYLALTDQMQMLHIADTRLPALNGHLPLGMGNLPVAGYCRALTERGFSGAAILEIGGLPQSGGYNRDTDDALRDSFVRLAVALPDAH